MYYCVFDQEQLASNQAETVKNAGKGKGKGKGKSSTKTPILPGTCTTPAGLKSALANCEITLPEVSLASEHGASLNEETSLVAEYDISLTEVSLVHKDEDSLKEDEFLEKDVSLLSEDILSVPESPESSPPDEELPLVRPPHSLYKPFSLHRRKSVSFAEDLPTKRHGSFTSADNRSHVVPLASMVIPDSPGGGPITDTGCIGGSDVIASTPLKPAQPSRELANQRVTISPPPCTPIRKEGQPYTSGR